MDRRKSKRFAELVDVSIREHRQVLDTAAAGEVNPWTHDISVSGARIESKEDFPVGYVMGIVLALKTPPKSVCVDGKVVWTRKSKTGTHFHIGVEFLHNFPDTILLLLEHFYCKKGTPPPAS